MQSALRYYGLIPESVYTISSMTTKCSRGFKTEIGRFDYIYPPSPEYFHIGIKQMEAEGYNFPIATPEKALCDLIACTPKLHPRCAGAMLEFLQDDLRLDTDAFYGGTCLRIFHSMSRFFDDLGFSLIAHGQTLDLEWYVRKGGTLNFNHFQIGTKQFNGIEISKEEFLQKLKERLSSTDIKMVKRDVEPVIKTPKELDI